MMWLQLFIFSVNNLIFIYFQKKHGICNFLKFYIAVTCAGR
jgi:hypothetical protein